MTNSIKVSRHSIHYAGLSGDHNIFAKTSLASKDAGLPLSNSSNTLPQEFQKYLTPQSIHWLAMEKAPLEKLAIARQIHGDTVSYIDQPGLYNGIDGFYTDQPDIYLTIQTADCAAIFVSAPEIPAVGIAHAGWRGAKGNIVGNLIGQMQKKWKIDPKLFKVAISPHIKNCCYEVVEEFQDYFKPYYLQNRNNQLFFYLEKVIIDQIATSGITKENLSVSEDCTYCSSLPLYSYRAQKKTSNRILSVIAIQK